MAGSHLYSAVSYVGFSFNLRFWLVYTIAPFSSVVLSTLCYVCFFLSVSWFGVASVLVGIVGLWMNKEERGSGHEGSFQKVYIDRVRLLLSQSAAVAVAAVVASRQDLAM